MPFLLLLIVLPLIEIFLFVEVGGEIGAVATVAIVILSAMAGAWILRRHSLTVLRDVQSRLVAGESPERALADAAMILIAGILLLIPGFLTDALGLLLLLPPVRGWLFRRATARVAIVAAGRVRTRHDTWHGQRSGAWPGGQTVEGEFEEIHPDGRRGRGHDGDVDHTRSIGHGPR